METLDILIERVQEAAASERNARRGGTHPCIGVGMEDPIAWAILFGFDARRYFEDPRFYLEMNLRQKLWRWENIEDDTRIGLDVPAWLGHYPEYTFFRMDVSVNARGVPVLQTDHPMTREPDLRLLEPVDFRSSGWMPRAMRWYEELGALAGERVPIHFITWNRGCLDLAIQLRGFDNFILDTIERPEFVHGLMRFLVEQRNAWYDARCAYLGEELGTTWIADDWIYVPFISPGIFADFVLPYYLEIERHHGAIGGVHSCGNQAPIQRYLLQIKTLNAFEVSAWTDLAATVANVPEEKHLGLSVHPNDVLVDGPDVIRDKLVARARLCRGRRFSLGTSGLTPIYDDAAEFPRRIATWLSIAREVFAEAA